MRCRAGVALLLTLPLLTASTGGQPAGTDPFAAFRPWIDVTRDEQARADRGETVVRILPSRGHEVAVLALTAITVTPETFVARFHAIEALRTSARSPATRRFSNPPVRADLATMRLTPEDLAAIRRCRPGDCDVKLAAAEIERLRRVADATAPGADEALQQAFRDVVFDRVTTYLAGGLAGLAPYADRQNGVGTADAFARLMARSPYLAAHVPALASALLDFPRVPADERDSFLYWTEERFDGRPVVSASHVTIIRNDPASALPAVMVAGKQLFATHYENGALGLTCLVGHEPQYPRLREPYGGRSAGRVLRSLQARDPRRSHQAGRGRAGGRLARPDRGRAEGGVVTMAQGTSGDRVTLCFTGDVMTGRGVDQLFTHASSPDLFEPFVRDAREYVALAERKNGRIARPIAYDYIWGDALDEWRRIAPDARIVNLETSITTSRDHDRGKEIHYRMHPVNVACLRAASIDVCVLANNHVLDWGRAGLLETLDTLERAGVRTAGAGRDHAAAEAPAVVARPGGGRVLVYACGASDSGIPTSWAAGVGRSGVDLLPDLSPDTARAIGGRIAGNRRPGDLVVVSLHWGGNWGYDVPRSHVAFAHALVDAGVDVVQGHSSHHPRPIEIYRDRPILYGCGDFLNDYEGIEGYEQFRGDLSLMYIATLDARTGALARLRLTPMRIAQMRLARASADDTTWLGETMDRISSPFGTRVAIEADGRLTVAGNPAGPACLWSRPLLNSRPGRLARHLNRSANGGVRPWPTRSSPSVPRPARRCCAAPPPWPMPCA